ncbi:MAG TPA: SH3 domain-containing protein [Terracidiphilus sp.]|nr:SH3 domain-containing protein [Terracidiphilus sp.]
MYLRDRVAAVSNRVGEVKNGEALTVVGHGRRFLQVKTAKGAVGWIPERAVIDEKAYAAFEKLGTDHKDSPVVATGMLRSEMYLHVLPGREQDRLWLLPGNTKVDMLERASVPRYPVQAAAKAKDEKKPSETLPGEVAPQQQSLEDWWLVRDATGRIGWMLGSRVDVDVPYTVGQYAEGQRIVGNYKIATVHDADAPGGPADEPEYVMALSPVKTGLPYDFDQIRVFTWSLNHHRYETAFRLRGIAGYLPITITSEPAKGGGTEPVFRFQISTSPNVALDPETGIARPIAPRTIAFALRETMVRRVGPDLDPLPVFHIEKKAKTTARRR